MPKTGQIARGVILNWVALGSSLVLGLLISPYVVRHLGNLTYGIWTLISSMIAYMGLLDLGLRGGVTRFVSRDSARKEHHQASLAVSAAFWLRTWTALLVLAISLVLSGLAIRLFHIPGELALPARFVIVITGASFAVALTCGVFGGVLAALHRFDLLSSITISQTMLRAGGTVWLLHSGRGIVALAIWELLVALLSNACLVILCFRVYPELRIFWRRPEGHILKQFWSYSIYVFIINVAVQVIYYTDNLVVGIFVSAQAVTFYAIGGKLIEYLRQTVSSLTATFTPLASNFDAQSRRDQLYRLLIHGTQGALLLALPIEIVLFLRGPDFIRLWMGEQYAGASGRILQILLIAQLFALANYTSGGIAYGLGKHRPVALWAMGEAIVNLVLSVVLVRRLGIYGVAWGTVVPSVVIHLLLWPRYISKILEVPVWDYIWESWIRPALSVVPFAVGCYLAERYWSANSLREFFVQTAALTPLIVGGITICFWPEVSRRLPKRDWWFRNSPSPSPPTEAGPVS